MDLTIVLRCETCFELFNVQFVWWRCVLGLFSSACGPTQMVTNDQSSPNLVCDFFVYEWLLLWCEEVLATIRLAFVDSFVDETPYFEPKMLYKWCSERNLANRATNAFRWWFAYRQRLNSHFVAKDEGYPELQLVISDFADILTDQQPPRRLWTYCYCTCI